MMTGMTIGELIMKYNYIIIMTSEVSRDDL